MSRCFIAICLVTFVGINGVFANNSPDDFDPSVDHLSVSDIDPEDAQLINVMCPTSAKDQVKNSTTDISCMLLKKLVRKSKSLDNSGQYIPPDYNKYEAPRHIYTKRVGNRTSPVVDPVECGVFLHVRDISDFDEGDEMLTLDLDVILLWTDYRILSRYEKASPQERRTIPANPVVLSPAILKKLWTPDIYFEEVVSLTQPTFMGNSITVVLNPRTGLVVYRSRVLAKLSCDMDFAYYPADIQNCSFTLKSFSFTTLYLKLAWIEQQGTGVYLHAMSDPNFDYQISQFSTEELPLDIGPATDNTSSYTNLQFTLLAKRKMTYHLVQTYFASVFFVVVTWLCFLIPPDMFEVRVGIAMSTLLTLTAMFAAVRESAPNVSYVKAIDIWMIFSIMFIFFALAGFTVTAWIKRGIKRIVGQSDENSSELNVSLDSLRGKQKRLLNERETQKRIQKYHIATVLTEKCAIYILSISFILFNVVYWSWLVTYSGYSTWNINSTMNHIDSQ